MMGWILSSAVLIAVLLLLRPLLLGRVSPRLRYALWALVLVRLLVPFSLGDADFSIMNAAEQSDFIQQAEALEGIGSIEFTSAGTVEGYGSDDPGREQPTLVVPDSSEADFSRMQGILSAREVFGVLWPLGTAVLLAVFAVSNLRFRARLRRSRVRLEQPDCPLPVYVTGAVETPCLFGLVRPAIYLPPQAAEDPAILHYALVHEETHFRHGDHVWALLRCLCLALHWFDPLVWLAVKCSRQDGELACDAGTIRRLGEDQRLAYGHSLIDLSCEPHPAASLFRTATTMTGSKRDLRQRLRFIAGKPRRMLAATLAVVLVAVLACACTFTGSPGSSAPPPNGAEEPTPEAPVLVHEAPEAHQLALAFSPTGLSKAGGDYWYLIPSDQADWIALLEQAEAAAETPEKAKFTGQTGIWLLYQENWWQLMESGILNGSDGRVIPESAAVELAARILAEAHNNGIAEPFRPDDIQSIVSADLYWGEHTVLTDPYALERLEAILTDADELYGGSACPFTALLRLTLKDGRQLDLSLATDSCGVWMSQGVFWQYAGGNEELFSLFAPERIQAAAKEGMEQLLPLLPYLDWSRYANVCGADQVIPLMDRLFLWASEEGLEETEQQERFRSLLYCTRGLDGAYTDYYAGRLDQLWVLYPKQLEWGIHELGDEQQHLILDLLAYQQGSFAANVASQIDD